MKLSVATFLLAAASADASLPPNHPPNHFLNDFAGHFRCPYAQEWLNKGPVQAARDLGLISRDENAHNWQRDADRALQQPSNFSAGGPPAGVDFSGPPITCQIAPGPIGAAHQAGYSSGYDKACPGTPAEGSPYMWPLAWTANVESKSMSAGSDDVMYHSIGKVSYRLDKNWKRQDWFYQRGIQRGLGQSPCAPENIASAPDEPLISCRRNSDRRNTMIHRGSQMFFITWKNETALDDDSVENIDSCGWMDLQIIGNVRPDWYMDDRGDSTDVQYLGDQHVFHANEPRLVKQWRKKDFASQYFVMSVLANTKDDGIHWPMTLNVPGEGFGDDFLQIYTNHSLLSDQDEALFLLDQALEAAGGLCPQMNSSGTAGPPVGEVDPIPSNLEVDPNSWFSNVYTYSPVWVPPTTTDADVPANVTNGTMSSDEPQPAVTQIGSAVVTSCYDSTVGAVELSITYTNVVESVDDELPWVALGYRETEECLMTPRNGGNSDIILVASSPQQQGDDELVQASFGSLSSEAKSFDTGAFASIYAGLVPLDSVDGFSNVQVLLPSDLMNKAESRSSSLLSSSTGSLELRFQQAMAEAPQAMNLMYAVGSGPELGYHNSRECFQVTEFPPCRPANSTTKQEVPEEDGGGDGTVSSSESTSAAAATLFGSFSVIVAVSTLLVIVM